MQIDDAFPSKYMKSADLPEETVVPFVIEKVETEEVGREKQLRPIIYFKGQDKGFVCNKTNGNTLKKILASGDTDNWIGKTIKLYRTEVQFGDEMVESIRVSIKGSKPPKPQDDEIPF